jgi:hypothetical protein
VKLFLWLFSAAHNIASAIAGVRPLFSPELNTALNLNLSPYARLDERDAKIGATRRDKKRAVAATIEGEY